jgi:hypothetical protein
VYLAGEKFNHKICNLQITDTGIILSLIGNLSVEHYCSEYLNKNITPLS